MRIHLRLKGISCSVATLTFSRAIPPPLRSPRQARICLSLLCSCSDALGEQFPQVFNHTGEKRILSFYWRQQNSQDNETSENLRDRKSTRLNSSHGSISYAVFCLKKK